jgi:hypothetical protein
MEPCRSGGSVEGLEQNGKAGSMGVREDAVVARESGWGEDVELEAGAEGNGKADWAGSEVSNAGDSVGTQEVWQQGRIWDGPMEPLRIRPRLPRMPQAPWLRKERQEMLSGVYVDPYIEKFCVFDQEGVAVVFFTDTIW